MSANKNRYKNYRWPPNGGEVATLLLIYLATNGIILFVNNPRLPEALAIIYTIAGFTVFNISAAFGIFVYVLGRRQDAYRRHVTASMFLKEFECQLAISLALSCIAYMGMFLIGFPSIAFSAANGIVVRDVLYRFWWNGNGGKE